MKLVFLDGPPGTGTLTVAREVSRLIASVTTLHVALAQFPDSFDTIPGTPPELGNSDLAPEGVARRIVSGFGLDS